RHRQAALLQGPEASRQQVSAGQAGQTCQARRGKGGPECRDSCAGRIAQAQGRQVCGGEVCGQSEAAPPGKGQTRGGRARREARRLIREDGSAPRSTPTRDEIEDAASHATKGAREALIVSRAPPPV